VQQIVFFIRDGSHTLNLFTTSVFFAVANIAFAIWAFAEANTSVTGELQQPDEHCENFNRFLHLFGWCCLVEAAVNALIAFSVWGMQTQHHSSVCAGFAFLNVNLFFLYFVGKTVLLILGVLWIWGEDARHCTKLVPSLSKSTSRYLTGMLIVFGYQVVLGALFMFGCGLDHLLRDAYLRCCKESQRKWDDDDDVEQEAQQGLLQEEAKTATATTSMDTTEAEELSDHEREDSVLV